MLKAGDPAPDFTLPDQTGRPVRLSGLLAAGPAVIFFYPKDNTMICTKEACSFRDSHAAFRAAGAQVAGISADDGTSHAGFADRHGLPYPLLTDGDGAVARAYGVGRLLGVLPGRATFVVDRAGVIRHAYRADFRAGAHAEESLAVLRNL
jgi:thioredoxin-dependent peroxiredoxin